MKANFFKLIFVATFGVMIFLNACEQMPTEYTDDTSHQEGGSFSKVTIAEGFETGTKTAYAAADVTLGSGVWNMNDALIGSLTTDRKVGLKSARVQNAGKITMKFDRTDGISTVSVAHAKFGSDGSSTWELWYSTNKGVSWIKSGSTVTTSSTTLSTATFTINKSGYVRIEIRKTGGGSNRINFDEIRINDFVPGGSASVHMTLGNPSDAITNTANYTNYFMEKSQYCLSYNRDRACPNWVAWHLNSSWLGSTPRQDNFRADATLPAGWYQVGGSSYSGSGFDRGHMCPSADRTLTVTDNSATFLMTNMVPQAPNNNQGPWAKLEDYCRTLATQGKELYIYSGAYGQQSRINNNQITVPTNTWKVIVVLDNGTNDLARVTTSTRVIAVNMTNYNSQISISADWKSFRVSVDSIESITGYDFLSNVDPAIQAVIESRVDNL